MRTSSSNIGQLETVNPASPQVLARDASNGPPGRCSTKISVHFKTHSLCSRCGTRKIGASYSASTTHILGSDSGYHRRRWPIETVSDSYFYERINSTLVGVCHIVASFATSVCMNDGSFDFGRELFFLAAGGGGLFPYNFLGDRLLLVASNVFVASNQRCSVVFF